MQRIGLIGLDTSHATAFASLLNDPQSPNHVGGARIACAFPGGSPAFALSRDRVAYVTRKVAEDHGVEVFDSIEAVVAASDLVMILSVDGRQHRGQFEAVAAVSGYRKLPVFIDKPFATTSADAAAMIDLAASKGMPLMSCSALRYADPLQAALSDGEPVLGIDAYGPMALQDELPGYFWYGVHAVEMIVASMGAGCVEVRAQHTADHDVLVLRWDDGRLATLHGLRAGHSKFGVTLHRPLRVDTVNASDAQRPYYASLMEAILSSLPHGRGGVPEVEMLDAVRIMEAATASRADGEAVPLEPAATWIGARS